MKILITGGVGFIGSHIAEFYANKGHEILCLDDFSRGGCLFRIEHLKQLEVDKGIEFHLCGVQDYENVNYEISEFQPDIIFHCAGQTKAITSIDIPHKDFMINALGTINVLESVRNSKCDPAIVFCSTNKVFGGLPTLEPTNEQLRADIMPKTPYGVSKASADFYCQEYAYLYGLKTGIFRMSCIYGVRQFGDEAQGWVAHFVISALLNKMITIFGNGHQLRDILYIDDLVRAFNNFINKADKLKGDVFCMGGGPQNIISLNGLIKILERVLDKDIKHQFADSRPADQQFYISDIRKAREFLNWLPIIRPYTGIELMVDWTKKNIDYF